MKRLDAAWAAARDAAWDAQVTKLIEMIQAEGMERVQNKALRRADEMGAG